MDVERKGQGFLPVGCFHYVIVMEEITEFLPEFFIIVNQQYGVGHGTHRDIRFQSVKVLRKRESNMPRKGITRALGHYKSFKEESPGPSIPPVTCTST
jgi:glutamate racemase